MAPAAAAPADTSPLRTARQAWSALHANSHDAQNLAQRALKQAQASRHVRAEGWARLTLGFHLVYFATLREAEPELVRAQALLEAEGDRAGFILAGAGLARALWRAGRFDEAIAQLLPLRDEALRVLKHEQRSVMLNIIAGCHSAAGQSEQAFAYMYQALRDVRPSRAQGYDAVIHCNLAHELLLLGDCHEALRHVDQGLERCGQIHNPRLRSVLLINRIICLTDLGRPQDALADVCTVRDLPADVRGRGQMAAHYETLAIAALLAGEDALGADLVARALAIERSPIADEHLEVAIAQALLARRQGDNPRAVACLRAAQNWVEGPGDGSAVSAQGNSLRVCCRYWQTLADALQAAGQHADALAALRHWQHLHVQQSLLASRSRYQAAALQTELLRLQHKLDENDARRRATERARAALEAANSALAHKVEEVQALQAALQQQATRDELTGLFNRRHMNDVLPTMLAMAQRDGEPLAAVMIDLDHFKRINDAHGHDAGDRLLAAFGLLLAEACRKSDVACRWGGEEFCLLMPRTSVSTARRKALSLLRRWRGERFDIGHGSLAGQTFSAGVSDTSVSGLQAASLLKAADDGLLAAKRAGRDGVRVHELAPRSAKAHGSTAHA